MITARNDTAELSIDSAAAASLPQGAYFVSTSCGGTLLTFKRRRDSAGRSTVVIRAVTSSPVYSESRTVSTSARTEDSRSMERQDTATLRRDEKAQKAKKSTGETLVSALACLGAVALTAGLVALMRRIK